MSAMNATEEKLVAAMPDDVLHTKVEKAFKNRQS